MGTCWGLGGGTCSTECHSSSVLIFTTASEQSFCQKLYRGPEVHIITTWATANHTNDCTALSLVVGFRNLMGFWHFVVFVHFLICQGVLHFWATIEFQVQVTLLIPVGRCCCAVTIEEVHKQKHWQGDRHTRDMKTDEDYFHSRANL